MGVLSPDSLPPRSSIDATSSGKQRVWVAGPYRVIGTTTKSSFVDRTAKSGGRYNYQVVALNSAGRPSPSSNVATTPPETSKAAFSDLNVAVRRLVGTMKEGAGGTTKLLQLTTAARASWYKTGPAASLPILGQLRNVVEARKAGAGSAAATVASSDVYDAIFRLQRRAQLSTACKG
jgi:hypothetical protein